MIENWNYKSKISQYSKSFKEILKEILVLVFNTKTKK